MKDKTAVILCNLGTPLQATSKEVRRFLGSFLLDKRVVEIPRALWLPILFGVVLPLRSKRVAKAYEDIWMEGGSPLQVVSLDQQRALADSFSDRLDVLIELAMTHGEPKLPDVLSKLRERGIGRFLILPMYPQYSATTTASVYDQVAEYVRQQRDIPEIRIIKDYHEHPLYITALANSIAEFRQAQGVEPFNEKGAALTGEKSTAHLLFSFHGIPQINVDKGDPYQHQCEVTAQLVAKELGLDSSEWTVSYQSRFGKQQWLKPYTDEFLTQIASKGVSVDVICPAFSVDCLETLEEINQGSRSIYFDAGGTQFNYIPCLNDRADHIQLLEALVKENL